MGQDNNNTLLIVTYHYIRSENPYPFPGIHPLKLEDFIEQVQWLKDRFHFATPQEVVTFAHGNGDLPAPSVFLTFDDGLSDHVKVTGEVLEPLHIKAEFSLSSRPFKENRALMVHKIHWLRATTDPEEFRKEFFHLLPETEVEMARGKETIHEATKHNPYDTPEHAIIKYLITFQLPHKLVDDMATEMFRSRGFSEASFCEEFYMNEQQIRYLTETGHIIGNHGHTHIPFSRLEEKQLQEEIRGSKSYFEKLTGVPQSWVSYPHGRQWAIPSHTDAFCKHFGFTIGLGVNAGWNREEQSPYHLNRVNPNEVEGVV